MTLREVHAILSNIHFGEALLSQDGQLLQNLIKFKKAAQELSTIPQFEEMA